MEVLSLQEKTQSWVDCVQANSEANMKMIIIQVWSLFFLIYCSSYLLKPSEQGFDDALVVKLHIQWWSVIWWQEQQLMTSATIDDKLQLGLTIQHNDDNYFLDMIVGHGSDTLMIVMRWQWYLQQSHDYLQFWSSTKETYSVMMTWYTRYV